MAMQKKGLGRGFETLFEDNTISQTKTEELRISLIEPNREQPRKNFDEVALNELAESISKYGLVQPILVRPTNNGNYQIVAGERRWRASRLAGLETVPVTIKEMDDTTAAEIALIENLQREDLNPIEEALGYKNLIEIYGMTQEKVALAVGKSRPAVTNSMRLLALNDEEQLAVQNKQITQGHARTLLSFDDEDLRSKALEMALNGASVRELENLYKLSGKKSEPARPRMKNKAYAEVEMSLSNEIGRKVKINGNGKSGILSIEFYDEDDLFDLARKIAGENK